MMRVVFVGGSRRAFGLALMVVTVLHIISVDSTTFPNWKARLATVESKTCETDKDCMYLGECNTQSQVCECDPGFKGSQCHQLDLLPTKPTWGFNNASMSSWGASVVKHEGEYHMVGSYMERNCDIASYGTNSAIMRATSKTPQGPYEYKETILKPFHHGAYLVKDKRRGMFYLWADGRTIPDKHIHKCKKDSLEDRRMPTRAFRDPSQKTGIWKYGESPHDFISVFQSKQLAFGDWTRNVILRTNVSAGNACNRTNPAPVLLDDGSVSLIVRTTYCDKEGNLCQINQKSGKNCQHMFQVRTSHPTEAVREGDWKMLKQLDGSEDPFIWKDINGRFHLLVHSKNACVSGSDSCGLLAVSSDGTEWTSARRPAFWGQVNFIKDTNQTVRQKVALMQRPKILFDDESRNPLFLIVGLRRTPKSHVQTLMIPFNVPENKHLVVTDSTSNDEDQEETHDNEEEASENINEGETLSEDDSGEAPSDEPSENSGVATNNEPSEDSGVATNDEPSDRIIDDVENESLTSEEKVDFDSLPASARKGGSFGWAFVAIVASIILGVRLSISYWKSMAKEYSAISTLEPSEEGKDSKVTHGH